MLDASPPLLREVRTAPLSDQAALCRDRNHATRGRAWCGDQTPFPGYSETGHHRPAASLTITPDPVRMVTVPAESGSVLSDVIAGRVRTRHEYSRSGSATAMVEEGVATGHMRKHVQAIPATRQPAPTGDLRARPMRPRCRFAGRASNP